MNREKAFGIAFNVQTYALSKWRLWHLNEIYFFLCCRYTKQTENYVLLCCRNGMEHFGEDGFFLFSFMMILSKEWITVQVKKWYHNHNAENWTWFCSLSIYMIKCYCAKWLHFAYILLFKLNRAHRLLFHFFFLFHSLFKWKYQYLINFIETRKIFMFNIGLII